MWKIRDEVTDRFGRSAIGQKFLMALRQNIGRSAGSGKG
jgi:hypothetical protein